MNVIDRASAVIVKAYEDAIKRKVKPRVNAPEKCKIQDPPDIQVPKFVAMPEVRKDTSMISGPFGMPVPGYVSSEFNPKRFHPIHKEVRKHEGIDIAAPRGTPVRSTGEGTATFVGVQRGYGKIIEITHTNGVKTKYAHLDTYAVKVGNPVKKGDIIGTVGKTGGATGYHLHYEIVKGGKAINPKGFM